MGGYPYNTRSFTSVFQGLFIATHTHTHARMQRWDKMKYLLDGPTVMEWGRMWWKEKEKNNEWEWDDELMMMTHDGWNIWRRQTKNGLLVSSIQNEQVHRLTEYEWSEVMLFKMECSQVRGPVDRLEEEWQTACGYTNEDKSVLIDLWFQWFVRVCVWVCVCVLRTSYYR